IDLYLAKDLAAGTYDGALAIASSGVSREIAIELEVLDATLPDTPMLAVMVYFEPQQVALFHGRARDEAYDRLAHRSLVEWVYELDEAGVRAAMDRYSGARFTRARGYEGPGEGVGNRIVPATFLS